MKRWWSEAERPRPTGLFNDATVWAWLSLANKTGRQGVKHKTSSKLRTAGGPQRRPKCGTSLVASTMPVWWEDLLDDAPAIQKLLSRSKWRLDGPANRGSSPEGTDMLRPNQLIVAAPQVRQQRSCDGGVRNIVSKSMATQPMIHIRPI
jgi:hypothetical protein